MKSHSVDKIPAVARLSQVINGQQIHLPPIVVRDIKYVLEGVEKLDQEVKLKNTQITTITKQKDGVISNLQQLVTNKTSEVQSKNSLLSQKEQLLVQKDKLINQKTTELQSKDSLLLKKEQLLSELKTKEENQLKEEYISVLHQLNPKVFSANYEDWTGKYQGYKDLIVNGNYETIKKHIPIHKQKLAKKIETEKLALETKEAERLEKAKEEVVSVLNQLHPKLYPANFKEWSTHPSIQNSKGKKVLDSNNLGAIEKKLVHYRELLKQKVQNEEQLILQKEHELKSLNDTFTSKLSIKDKEITEIKLKNTEVSHKVKKVGKKLAAKDKLISDKNQEIENLKALLTQKNIEIQNKNELLVQKDVEKQEALNHKDEEISGLNVQIKQLSHIDFGVQVTGNNVSIQVHEIDLAGVLNESLEESLGGSLVFANMK